MPCNLYNNNGFGCGGCTHFVRSNSITQGDGTITINITLPTTPINNGYKTCICLAQAIPATASSTDTVTITINGADTLYPLRTKCGNNVHADMIRSRKVYHTYLATDIPCFVVNRNELCPTSFNYPTITPTT